MLVVRRYLWGAVAAAVLLGSASAGLAQTCSLELKRPDISNSNGEGAFFLETSRNSNFAPRGQLIRVGNGDRSGEFSDLISKELDEYQSEYPVRGILALGSNRFGFVVDSSLVNESEVKGDDDGVRVQIVDPFAMQQSPEERAASQVVYDLLYLDRNQNGNLTDDEVVKLDPADITFAPYPKTSFLIVDVPLTIDSIVCDYSFTLEIMTYGSDMRAGTVRGAAYREGEITIEGVLTGPLVRNGSEALLTSKGENHRIVLVDHNNNGRFDDKLAIPEHVRLSSDTIYLSQGDRLYIDPDMSNQSRDSYSPAMDDDYFDVSDLIAIDGQLYDLAISPSGDELSLEPSDVTVGYVSNPNPNYRALAYGEQGFMKLIGDESGKTPLPVGEWKLYGYKIDLTDIVAELEEENSSIVGMLSRTLGPKSTPPGGPGTIVTATATRDYKAVEVVEGETVEMPFGAPYRPVVSVGYAQGDGRYSLGLSLVGAADEVCESMYVNGAQPGKPKFTITTDDGEIVEEGQFDYG